MISQSDIIRKEQIETALRTEARAQALGLQPDYVPEHHSEYSCGSVYGFRNYHYFVCARCRRIVCYCFGCSHEDPYLAACCDDCSVELGGPGKF